MNNGTDFAIKVLIYGLAFVMIALGLLILVLAIYLFRGLTILG